MVLFFCLFWFLACTGNPPPPPPPPTPAPAPAPAPTPDPAPAPESAPAPTPTPTPAPQTPSRATDLVLDGAETYTVVKGDTLSGISRKKYKDGFYYPLIMMASPGIVEDQDLIEPGMVLTIPSIQANLDDSRARQSMKKYFLDIAYLRAQKRPKDADGLRDLANSW